MADNIRPNEISQILLQQLKGIVSDARFDETGKAWPLVFEAKCGKGRLVYQAAPIALSLFADEVAMRKPLPTSSMS